MPMSAQTTVLGGGAAIARAGAGRQVQAGGSSFARILAGTLSYAEVFHHGPLGPSRIISWMKYVGSAREGRHGHRIPDGAAPQSQIVSTLGSRRERRMRVVLDSPKSNFERLIRLERDGVAHQLSRKRRAHALVHA